MSEKCPMCGLTLYKKYEGLVCKNHHCKLYFKLERGWVLLTKERKDSVLFFKSSYDFDINSFEGRKKWLQLKSEVLYEKGCCEICKSDRCLHVHHILPRSSNPELAMDKENLMVLCESCHKKIHSEDKYKYS